LTEYAQDTAVWGGKVFNKINEISALRAEKTDDAFAAPEPTCRLKKLRRALTGRRKREIK
jgi:hypothetical protein